jgi:ribosome maturation factor RimP
VVYTVPFDLVDNAKLVLTDKLITASRPIDMTGADTIVEEQED